MKIKATNNCVWVIREIPPTEVSGIYIPDNAKKKAHRGKVITVGKAVHDKGIVVDSTAVFNQTSGFELELDGTTYVILRDTEIVGVE